MINLKNQKAAITGASRGIGKSIALKLADNEVFEGLIAFVLDCQ